VFDSHRGCHSPFAIFHLRPTIQSVVLDLRPWGIMKMLDLIHPMYQATAAYGHFGREPHEASYHWQEESNGAMVRRSSTFTAFSWERTDRAEALRKAAGL